MTKAMGAAMRRIQAGSALSAFGLGFTVPYLYVYVAQVRDLGATTAGIVLAVFAMAALVALPFSGRAIDRRGPLPSFSSPPSSRRSAPWAWVFRAACPPRSPRPRCSVPVRP